MFRLEYVSGTGRETVKLSEEPTYSGAALEVRSYEWDYTRNYRGISGANRPARDAELDVWTFSFKEADRMRRIFDRDVSNRTPGTLRAESRDGVWEQRALVTKSDVQGIAREHVHQKLTVELHDGVWRRESLTRFKADDDEQTQYAYLDYPFDYAYDYGQGAPSTSVITDRYSRAPIKLVIYGPVTDPAITIGGNVYQVNATVTSGGYILVDGISKSIASVTNNGTVTNIFEAGVRGTGEGGGSYIFEKLQPGENAVSWNKTFNFDLYTYDESGAPSWVQATV